MFVVAITRLARPPGEEAVALAELVDGVVAYEMRVKLSGALPLVFAREPDAERARELLAALRERGHGAIACDESFVASSQTMLSPKDYSFDEDAFTAIEPGRDEAVLPYGDILALIRAGATRVEQRTRVEKKKKLALGRAVMTGGLMMRKSVEKAHQEANEEREQVLYVVRKGGTDPMILVQGRLHHGGLGARAAATSLANFQTMVTMLRERAPNAFYDDRLLSRRRGASFSSMSGTAGARSLSGSNTSENDLAAHLLVMAHLKDLL